MQNGYPHMTNVKRCLLKGIKILLFMAGTLAIATFSVLAYHPSTEMTPNVLANRTGREIVLDRFPDGDSSQYVKIWNCAKGDRNEVLFYKQVDTNSSSWFAEPYFASGFIDGRLYAISGFYWDRGKNEFSSSRFPLVVTRIVLVLAMLFTGGFTWLVFVRKSKKARK